MKKILLIDMDSVIVDLMTDWHTQYNQDYNDDITLERVTDWDAVSYVKPECGEKIYDYLHKPGLFAGLKPLPHAIEVLERLHRFHELLIVTASPSPVAYEEKERWINQHLPFIGSQNIIFAKRKERVCGDVLFDDAPHNLTNFMETGRTAIAMDYPYNRKVNCLRAANWLEFEQIISELF